MNALDPQVLLENLGTLSVFGVSAIIFLETSTIIGSLLPGDSLLFLLGLSLATWLNTFPIYLAIPIVLVGATTGAQVGYWFGKKLGPLLFEKDRGLFLNRKSAERTKDFFEKYGNRALIMARFVPILRALIPMFAAIARMPSKTFIKLNVISAGLWVVGLISAGYFLGQIDFVKKNVEVITVTFAVISSLPLPLELLRERIARQKSGKHQG
jgi:membrane-associated protein